MPAFWAQPSGKTPQPDKSPQPSPLGEEELGSLGLRPALELLTRRLEGAEEKIAQQQVLLGALLHRFAEPPKLLGLEVSSEAGREEPQEEPRGTACREPPPGACQELSPPAKQGRRTSMEVAGIRRTMNRTTTAGGEEIETYRFSQSFWDASLLLYFSDLALGDKVILVIGLLINFSLQLCLVATVYFDMLQTDYTESRAGEMLEWRVKAGQADANFNSALGQSKAERLCGRQLWSFEQQEYDLMYDYLYKPVPGFFLSCLALMVWVLTCMAEFRHVMGQLLCVLNLPKVARHEPTTAETDDGIEVVGLTQRARCLALTTLCVPRLTVLVSLMLVGCPFLANTIELSEIVLNAVALTVVLDVNRCLEHVMLSHRLRNLADLMLPIPCGVRSREGHGGITFIDVVRWGLAIFVVSLSVCLWLIPFNASVMATAASLCGGRQDFTYSGGDLTEPTLTLKVTSGFFEPQCAGESWGRYMGEHYTGWNGTVRLGNATHEEVERQTMNSVLSYAFGGCSEPGYFREPSEDGQGKCVRVPQILRNHLPPGALQGGGQEPPECPRFNASRGCAVEMPELCKWSWHTSICEAGVPPPGVHRQRACRGSSVLQECEEWAAFGMEHPTKRLSCEAFRVCGASASLTCLSLVGTLDLRLNATLLLGDILRQEAYYTELSIKQALQTVLQLPQHSDMRLLLNFSESPLRLPARLWLKGLPTRLTTQRLEAAASELPILVSSKLLEHLQELYFYQPDVQQELVDGLLHVVKAAGWAGPLDFVNDTTLGRHWDAAAYLAGVAQDPF